MAKARREHKGDRRKAPEDEREGYEMRQGGYWVVYKIISGSTVERIKSWRRGAQDRPRRRRIRGSSTLKKLEANLRSAVKHLARVLNCNFRHGDLHVVLTYDEAHLPGCWQEAERDAAAFIKRFKRAMVRNGVETVKWVTVCSNRNGKTGQAERWHVHVVATGAGITWHDDGWWIGGKSMAELWGLGSAWAEPLHEQGDYTGLAAYLLRQAGREPDRKKYHVSRNMEKPIIEETIVATGRELRAPAGCKVMEKHYEPENGVNYIRYTVDKGRRERETRNGGAGGGV